LNYYKADTGVCHQLIIIYTPDYDYFTQ